MAHNDVSEALLSGFESALDIWASRFGGERDSLFWVLRVKVAETNGGPGRHAVLAPVADDLKRDVLDHIEADGKYWDNVRYANLDRVTQLWGVVVNTVRVVADSRLATEGQKKVFAYPVESLVAFFRSARERMEVADQLFHCFKPMPAPECQTLAALLNVHACARLDADILVRLVRLLDDEGPLTEDESAALDTLTNTGLVDAAFRGLRGEA